MQNFESDEWQGMLLPLSTKKVEVEKMEEIWKDVEGFEGLYMVSNFGNVKSLNYAKRGYAKILSPKKNNRGRLWVELRNCGNKKQFLIHRLVAMAFIPNPNNYPQINHIDENPQNNNVENLEWCTGEYNIKCYLKMHPPYKRKVKNYSSKYQKRIDLKVKQYTKNGELVKVWENSRQVQLENGWNDWAISECCKRKRKSAYGFVWQYAN